MIMLLLQPKLWPVYLLLAGIKMFSPAPEVEADFAYLSPVSGMEFEYIPFGSFMMGSPASEEGRNSDEGPTHSVDIESFEMMTTEVTTGMWNEVTGDERDGKPDTPVNFVSWNQAQDFIEQVNILDPRYTYRLPSESEWEYACRAGSDTRFFWGESASPAEADLFVVYDLADDAEILPAGDKYPNGWGLYDMSGSLWEWCEDGFFTSYDNAPSDGTARGATEEEMYSFHRVLRGGSFVNGILNCRSAERNSCHAADGTFNSGFRLVRTEN